MGGFKDVVSCFVETRNTAKVKTRNVFDFENSLDQSFTWKDNNWNSLPFDTYCPLDVSERKGLSEKMSNSY